MACGLETRVYDPTDHTAVGQGEPIVLLPGLFAGEWIWDAVREGLRAEGFRVISLSHPLAVFGRSLAGIEDLRRCLVRLMDDLAVPSATFVANSLGGLVALDLARTIPSMVRGLVLSGTPGLRDDANLGLGFPRRQDAAFAEKVIDKLFYSRISVPRPAVEQICEMLSHRRYFVNYARLLQASRGYDIRGVLPTLACPVLLLWGRQDGVTPLEDWETVLPLIPDARLRVVEECGHSPMIEKPEEFRRVLVEFLRETTPAVAAREVC